MASFSISLAGSGSKSRKQSPPPSAKGVKRAHAALDDADSDDEDLATGKRQNITHFDVAAGGAVDVSRPKTVKEALVIKPQANRDWKEASQRNKRKKYGLPTEDEQKERQNFVPPQASTSFGLDVHKDAPDEGSAARDGDGDDTVQDAAKGTPPAKQQTEDERAIAALMGIKEDSTLTIPAVSEEEVFERDYQQAPDAPTLAEYAAVPVEEFGAAMLRGMGWKEGQGIGNQKGKKTEKFKMPERRPALLGIGAKPDAAVAAELGAWGAGAKGKRRPDIVYNPLVLKNATTGEVLTEEELKGKLQAQKESEAAETHASKSDRGHDRQGTSSRRQRYDDEPEDDAARRRRDRRRERDYDDSKSRSRRDRSASYDRHRSKHDKASSYDREREPRRSRDQDYGHGDGKDRERHRNDRDHDRRHHRRDRDYYEDDRDRRRKHR